jgi:hypothetical protein
MATSTAPTQQDYQRTTTTVSNTSGEITPGLIRDRWEASQRASITERRNFWLNSAFIGGEQWVSWDTTNNRLVEVPPDGERLQLTENRLWPSVRTLCAKLLKRPLVFEVAPTTADDSAQEGARTAQSVLLDVHHRHDWERLRHTNALQSSAMPPPLSRLFSRLGRWAARRIALGLCKLGLHGYEREDTDQVPCPQGVISFLHCSTCGYVGFGLLYKTDKKVEWLPKEVVRRCLQLYEECKKEPELNPWVKKFAELSLHNS